MYQIIFAKQAAKDAKKLTAAHLSEKAQRLLQVLARNPYQSPPPYEKLQGIALSIYSRRISLQHRLVYEVRDAEKTVHVLRMWTHYE